MIKQKIKKDLEKAVEKTLSDLQKPVLLLQTDIHLEHPENLEHGDYSSNFAMAKFEEISKYRHIEIKNPIDLAQKIVKSFPKTKYLEKIEAVSPGFINFYLKDKVFISQLKEIIKQKERYGSHNIGKETKTMVEFGQPNTHKLPHVGHFRSYALGESIARLLEFTGFNVFRANYQGDVGLQVAKCLWGYLKKIQNSTPKQNEFATGREFKVQSLEKRSLEEKIKILQKSYVVGNKAYRENPKAKKEIDQLNTKIYNQEKDILDLWKKTRKWSLNYYAQMNKRLGTKYHRQYFESEAAREGKKIVLENLNKVFKKSKGAIIFEGSKYGLHDRVFISSNGNPTYEAKDLALMFLKKKDFDYDLSLVSTASEQSEYFKVVYKAAELIAPELAKKFVHIPFGLITLSGAKLASRKGTIVSINELLENTKKALINLMEEKEYTQKQIKKIAEDLTIGASKYSILKHTPIKNVDFNIKQSVALQGNSGPYLQYTHARACSILRKSVESLSSIKADSPQYPPAEATPQALRLGKALVKKRQEVELTKLLYKFPGMVEEAARKYSPNLICNYLFELAQAFNHFYEALPVLKAENEKVKKARLVLVQASAQVIKNGLNLLGISAPETM